MFANFHIPNTPGNMIRLKETIDFLEYRIGIHEFLWQCPISKEHVGISIEKRTDGYYRDPSRITLKVVAPRIFSLPSVTYEVDSPIQLISALKSELRC